jgi:CYTH domain-containing protein/predicted ATPase
MLKVCLTGGPGAGKTEISSHLTEILEERGYKVVFVPESPTELILNGIKPDKNISGVDFQNFVMDMQLSKEKIYNSIENYYDSNKVIIFYDRGLLDELAYVDKDTFGEMISKRGLTYAEIYSHYDAVLHLVTAANGAEKYYQWNDPSKPDCGNNAARSESPEQAREKDRITLESWVGHPHLRVFDNSTDFKGKVKRVVDEVFALLGEPVPKEIERKYLIKMPTTEEISQLGCISETNIIQTYLRQYNNKTERRVRQRGTKESGFTFYYTEKTEVSLGTRIEKERRISQNDYITYLTESDTSLHQISKTRRCFIYDKRYFELDTYPFDNNYAILEIEVNDINEQFSLPPFTIIKEVTSDNRFKNHSLAKTMQFDLTELGED